MTRVKRDPHARKRHKKKLKIVQGFRGASSLLFKNANQQYLHAFQNAFADRRLRKRFFRSLWIRRLNAKMRQFGLNYHSFIYENKKMNRKICAQLLLHENSFLSFYL